MSIASIDERRRSFDQMAELYARARGSAPAALFDALAAYVPAPADALEIGCGPGNASLPLLERGFRIHAVELGEKLAAFARERLAAFPFTVEVGRFEDARLPPASVDLVVCSSAFHWLDRERALRQVVKVLKPGGAFALIWGSPRRTAEDNRVDEALRVAYRAHAPEISRETVDRMGGKVERDWRGGPRDARAARLRGAALPADAPLRPPAATSTSSPPSRTTRPCRPSSARGCSTPSARSSTASSADAWSGTRWHGSSSRDGASRDQPSAAISFSTPSHSASHRSICVASSASSR